MSEETEVLQNQEAEIVTDAEASDLNDQGFDGDTNEISDADDISEESLLEEIEYEGKQYKLPPELKSALLRQSDYTKKTQEVAEQRRAIEHQRQEIENHVKLQQATFQEAAKVAAMDEQIAQFNQVDWTTLSQQDPVKAQELFFQFSQLKDQRNAAATQINAKMQQKAFEDQQLFAKKLEESEAVLQREIPNWSPAVEKQLYDTGVQMGFSDHELRMIAAEPRIVKLIYAQHRLNQLEKQSNQTKPSIKPVTNIQSKSSVGKKDLSEMSQAEFEKRRREIIKARRN